LHQAFCIGNPANQEALFPHMSLFGNQLTIDVGAEDTITVLLFENRRLCTAVSDDVFWELAAQVRLPVSCRPCVFLTRHDCGVPCAFSACGRVVWSYHRWCAGCGCVVLHRGVQIERSGRRPELLRPFVSLMRCGDVPIKKNQTRTLQVLIQPTFSRTMLLYNTPEERGVRFEIIKVRPRRCLPSCAAVSCKSCALVCCTLAVFVVLVLTCGDSMAMAQSIAAGKGTPQGRSELAYHILLVRLMSISTEGKNGVAETTCQNLLTTEDVLEHLKVRRVVVVVVVGVVVVVILLLVRVPSSLTCCGRCSGHLELQSSSTCFELKTAMLEFLSNVYLDTDDPIDGTELEVRVDYRQACVLWRRTTSVVSLCVLPLCRAVATVGHHGAPGHAARPDGSNARYASICHPHTTVTPLHSPPPSSPVHTHHLSFIPRQQAHTGARRCTCFFAKRSLWS
jgi:hypothetical protein